MSSSYRRSLRTILRGTLRYLWGKRGERRVKGWRMLYRLRVEALLRVEEPFQSLTRHAEVRLWVDGEEAFARLEKLFSRARHTIVIQMFIWKDDAVGRRIAAVLVEAADRGVMIHIAKEAVGDFFEVTGDFITTKHEKDRIWQRFWNHPRIKITHSAQHDHAKVYVIDDHTLLLTGMNIAQEYLEWHDYMVELRGTRFVAQYLTDGEFPVARKSAPRSEPVQLIMNTPMRKEIRPAVMQLLQSARRSILIEQCYFSDPAVVSLLSQRSRHGVRIIIVLPETPDLHRNANYQAIGNLLASAAPGSVRVFLYPGIVHGKVILVDRKKMLLGSANLITSSLDEMGEVCVLVEGRYRMALLKLREVLRRDIFKSKPMTSPPQLRWIGKWLAGMGL
ncbi:phosphatidylserine/phosphatidylglycerophosphate/cardiolipin synthase family protein [Candidatus Peregrinibacteria bacterium]|nr:phosphatidylserine/phosphatidylglycerophosphate/cardiolipin synthase family protein [Candidatus Peregrinibacteria bacterium]